MREILNCPNCGAPIDGDKCTYCGTHFYDWSVIDSSKPSYIKIRHEGQLVMLKAIMRSLDFHVENEFANYYADDKIISTVVSAPSATLDVDFKVVPQDKVLYSIMKG